MACMGKVWVLVAVNCGIFELKVYGGILWGEVVVACRSFDYWWYGMILAMTVFELVAVKGLFDGSIVVDSADCRMDTVIVYSVLVYE